MTMHSSLQRGCRLRMRAGRRIFLTVKLDDETTGSIIIIDLDVENCQMVIYFMIKSTKLETNKVTGRRRRLIRARVS